MKKFLALLVSILLLFGAAACNEKSEYYTAADGAYQETEKGTPSPVYAKTYEAIGGRDVMPIGTFYGPSTGCSNCATGTAWEYFCWIRA